MLPGHHRRRQHDLLAEFRQQVFFAAHPKRGPKRRARASREPSPQYVHTIDMSQHTDILYPDDVVSTEAGAQRACAAAALAARRVQRALRRATNHLTRGRATPRFSERSDDAGRARSDSSPATAGGSLQDDLRHRSSSADVARTRYHGHTLCVCAEMQSRRSGVSLACDLQHEAEAGCVHRP